MHNNLKSFAFKQRWLLAGVVIFSIYYCLSGSRVSLDPDSPDKYYLLTGDEPAYLLLAHSIAFDGDIDLKNNRVNKDYRAYSEDRVSGYVKTKDFWLKYVKGKLRDKPDKYWASRCYSVCPPGMPFLAAPAYKIGHYWGGRIRYCVSLLMMLLIVGTLLLSSDIVRRITKSYFMALVCGLCLAISGPMIFYTVQIYPDVPGAFFIMLAVWFFYRVRESCGVREYILLVLFALTVGYLPWLHARFWPFTVIFGVFAFIHVLLNPNKWYLKLAALGLPFLAVSVPLLFYYKKLYGVPYPVSTHPPISLKVGLTSGWIGLWLDRNNGLLWYTPAAVFSIAGLWIMLRKGSLADRMIVLLIISNWLLIGTFSDWRAGLCSPLRYWLPVFALLAVPCAVCFKNTRNLFVQALGAAAGMVGIVIGVTAMLNPGRMFKFAHPVLPYWAWTRFYQIAPKFFPEAKWGDVWRGALFICIIIVLTVILVRIAGRNAHSKGESIIDDKLNY